jgi:RNA polymerase sigma-70 factor (ECF subfamily)
VTAPVDREWIRSIVEAYERPLTIYAARLTGDRERGRDVVQDAFLKLWQADRKTVEDHVAKWLYTVCRNRALDVRRKEQRMTTLSDKPVEAPADGVPAAEVGEAAGGMLAAVERLPERQQEAVRLKFQGGLSYREIAEVMNTTVGNVGVMLHTAIKSLRGHLAVADGSAAIAAPVTGATTKKDAR